MDIAQGVEDRNMVLQLKGAMGHKFSKPILTASRGDPKNPETFPTRTVTVGEKTTIHRREFPIKQMTDAEWQARKDKGRGFRCDEKYPMGHHAKIRSCGYCWWRTTTIARKRTLRTRRRQ